MRFCYGLACVFVKSFSRLKQVKRMCCHAPCCSELEMLGDNAMQGISHHVPAHSADKALRSRCGDIRVVYFAQLMQTLLQYAPFRMD